jgi:NAD(P)H-dependent FMN reductase
MTRTPRIALIVTSTRDSRWAEEPAHWMLKQAQARTDLEVDLIDLKDFDLPLFNEPASNLWMPSSDPRAVAWQEKLAEYDGYIFTVAEYNHSITGALKNALDQAGKEWARKPMAAIAYGGTGASRALEHLRNIAVELQMVPTRNAVHIGGADFFKAHPIGGDAGVEAIEDNLKPSATATLDDLVWWANATIAARQADTEKAAA